MKHSLLLLIFSLLFGFAAMAQTGSQSFVRADGMHLTENGKPFRFLGANMWYAVHLASEIQEGNRTRLCAEFDRLKGLGINTVRLLAVSEEPAPDDPRAVRPALVQSGGTLNDTLLSGMDYVLTELGKRNMRAVLSLTNTYSWSGGLAYYLRETGDTIAPMQAEELPEAYAARVARFYANTEAVKRYQNTVQLIVNRTNGITGKAYKNDPTILAWELCNEPQTTGGAMNGNFISWAMSTAAIIRKADPNHLISLGTAGIRHCADNERIYEMLYTTGAFGFASLQLQPLRWDWAHKSRTLEDLPNTYLKATDYYEQHRRIAQNANLPLVLTAFAYPRDRHFFTPDSPAFYRKAFYEFVMSLFTASVASNDVLSGGFISAWSGENRADDFVWRLGVLTGDNPCDPQGLYSVFATDTPCLETLKEGAKVLNCH